MDPHWLSMASPGLGKNKTKKTVLKIYLFLTTQVNCEKCLATITEKITQ